MTDQTKRPQSCCAMAITFRILKPNNLIAVTVSGRLQFEDLRNVAVRLKKDPDFVWSHDRIIFLKRDASFSEMKLGTFRDAKEAMKKEFFGNLSLAASDLPAYRVAIVCRPSINEIVMKMFGAIWKADATPLVAVRHFEFAPEALNWFGQETIQESEFSEEIKGM